MSLFHQPSQQTAPEPHHDPTAFGRGQVSRHTIEVEIEDILSENCKMHAARILSAKHMVLDGLENTG